MATRHAKRHTRTYRILPVSVEYDHYAPAYGPLTPVQVSRLRRIARREYLVPNRENAALVILPSRRGAERRK